MTHDELLADIKKSCPDEDICKNCCALLAVVELHKPDEWGICETCNVGDYAVMHPCPTIQAIEKELK